MKIKVKKKKKKKIKKEGPEEKGKREGHGEKIINFEKKSN